MIPVRNSALPAWLALIALLALGLYAASVFAQTMREVLGPGDTVRISAFRYPDLTTEARISDDGQVRVPMIGQVEVQGLTPEQAAKLVAEKLKSGGFINNPQIDVAVIQARSRQVSVLGFVTRPGRYALEGTTARVTDVLAMAGGLVPEAADTAVVTRLRDGKSESHHVDVGAIIRAGDNAKNIEVRSGDSIFVPKAPVVYVYGEVMRGGSYRLEQDMTVMQAISVAGGISPRGSERRLQLRRKTSNGQWQETSPGPHDKVVADDVIYVRESLF